MKATIDLNAVVNALSAFRSRMTRATRKGVTEASGIVSSQYSSILQAEFKHTSKGLLSRNPKSGNYEVRPVHLHQGTGARVYRLTKGREGFGAAIGPQVIAKPRHAHLLEDGSTARVRLKGRHPKGIGGYYYWVELAIRSGSMSETKEGGVPRRRTGTMTGSKPLRRAYNMTIDQALEIIKTRMAGALKQ